MKRIKILSSAPEGANVTIFEKWAGKTVGLIAVREPAGVVHVVDYETGDELTLPYAWFDPRDLTE